MTLEAYHAKRDFRRTREPHGSVAKKIGATYVIQKHAASRLHYDFRLELDGVLLSWAVPKGPSLDPRQKRLAMQTEDHPIAYADFEGTIPKGEYGGGTVMVWDTGTWEPVEGRDARKDYERGRMSFVIHGEKLRGRWHLVRSPSADGERKKWILFKGADDEAKRTGSIVDEAPTSAVTGRTMEEIAEARTARPKARRRPSRGRS
jgi:bifunctional non-homologous end joining protein LigD